MNPEYTGKKIAELRKAKNLTQKELANKLHVTDKAVSKWERGMNFPDLGLMEALATELDTTPSILLGLETATKEELVNSFLEVSTSQSEEAEKDIQKIGWLNLFTGIFLMILMYFINIKLQRNGLYFESETGIFLIYGLISIVVIGAVYTLRKYKAIKKWELLDTVLTEVLIVDIGIFLGIQLFTGCNPVYFIAAVQIGAAAVCLQLLFYRVMRPQWVKILPLVGMVCWACWGILLKVSEAEWVESSIWNLMVYSLLPAVCSLVVWWICRKKEKEKESLLPIIKIFAGTLLIICIFIFMFGQNLLAKTYVKVFHKQLEVYAENLLKECDYTTSDRYGIWKVSCHPEDELVEFRVGGAGLVANSTYYGFYYSPDDTHKTFQGADVPLNINKDLADWYGEGDNWGKSTRMIKNWFWYEAHF